MRREREYIPSAVGECESVAWLLAGRVVGGGIEGGGEAEGAPSPVGGARKIENVGGRGGGGGGSHGEGPKRFMVAHIKESALIESLRGVCSSLLIWLNIPD